MCKTNKVQIDNINKSYNSRVLLHFLNNPFLWENGLSRTLLYGKATKIRMWLIWKILYTIKKH